jgi:hypothetical protein
VKTTLLSALLLSTAAQAVEIVEVSAPIFPRTPVLYAQEGANYPSTQAARESLVTNASLTFDELLQACAPQYPGISLQNGNGNGNGNGGNGNLSQQQLAANYQLVAQCSYEQYTAKPYWIPQLVSDVTICEQELGPDWHLLTEADINGFSPQDFQFFQNTLTDASNAGGNTSFWGFFYFGLKVFIRAADGSIQQGDLTPGVSVRVAPLTYPQGWTAQQHYEGGLALRCIRRTQVP